MMSDESDLKVVFSDEYKFLLKQAKSLLSLCNTLQSHIAYLSQKDYTLSELRLKELEDNLESEKEMNHILTIENNRLQKLLNEMSGYYEK